MMFHQTNISPYCEMGFISVGCSTRISDFHGMGLLCFVAFTIEVVISVLQAAAHKYQPVLRDRRGLPLKALFQVTDLFPSLMIFLRLVYMSLILQIVRICGSH